MNGHPGPRSARVRLLPHRAMKPLPDMTDEAFTICDTHDYALLRWSTHAVQALHAASRVRPTHADDHRRMTRWAMPRQAVAVLDYRDMPTPSTPSDVAPSTRVSARVRHQPGRTIASHVPHAMWTCSTWSRPRYGPRPPPRRPPTPPRRSTPPPRHLVPTALLTYGVVAVAAPDDDTAFRAFDEALGVPDVDQWPFDLGMGPTPLRRTAPPSSSDELRPPRCWPTWTTRSSDSAPRPWTRRASNELRATGHSVGPPERGTESATLTPQQLEIAEPPWKD